MQHTDLPPDLPLEQLLERAATERDFEKLLEIMSEINKRYKKQLPLK